MKTSWWRRYRSLEGGERDLKQRGKIIVGLGESCISGGFVSLSSKKGLTVVFVCVLLLLALLVIVRRLQKEENGLFSLKCPVLKVKVVKKEKERIELKTVEANCAALDCFGLKLVGSDLSLVLKKFSVEALLSGGNRRQIYECEKGRFMVVAVIENSGKTKGEKTYTVLLSDISKVLMNVEEREKRLLSHFAHELKNKYAIAASVLERVYEHMSKETGGETDSIPDSADEDQAETASCASSDSDLEECKGNLDSFGSSNSTVEKKQFRKAFNSSKKHQRQLVEDMALSVGLLREADRVIETRMQLHKMLNGTYMNDANIEIIEASELIDSRLRIASGLSIHGHNVQIVSDLSACPGITKGSALKIDTFLFNHIANNLLSNAKKSIDSSFGLIEFSLLDAQNDMLLFSCRDNGRGISPKVLSRLFENNLATTDARGTGIGLYSCRQFARAAGGNLWLHSTKNASPFSPTHQKESGKDQFASGTEFRFSLPGYIVTHISSTDSLRRTSLSQSSLSAILSADMQKKHFSQGRHIPKQATVYIVDDSILIRKSIRAKFCAVAKKTRSSFHFFDHDTVESILPFIQSFAHDPCAIITVDENLSSTGGILSGTDLIRALSLANFQGIIISASGCNDTANIHLQLGAHIKFGKPLLSVNKIIEALDQVFIGRQRATRTSFPWDDQDTVVDKKESVKSTNTSASLDQDSNGKKSLEEKANETTLFSSELFSSFFNLPPFAST